MNRKQIMDDCPEGYEDTLKEIIDYFEGQFNDIHDRLTISDISDLYKIEEALDIAGSVGKDLY